MPGTPLRYNRFAYHWKLASLVHARRDMPLSAVCLDLIVAHPVPSECAPALLEPWTEGSRHGSHAGFACKLRHQMWRNQIAKLSQYTEFAGGWFGVSFFHLCRVAELKSHANHFFLCFSQNFYGMP